MIQLTFLACVWKRKGRYKLLLTMVVTREWKAWIIICSTLHYTVTPVCVPSRQAELVFVFFLASSWPRFFPYRWRRAKLLNVFFLLAMPTCVWHDVTKRTITESTVIKARADPHTHTYRQHAFMCGCFFFECFDFVSSPRCYFRQ